MAHLTTKDLSKLYIFTEADLNQLADYYAESVFPNANEPEGQPETVTGFIEFLLDNSNPLTEMDVEDLGFTKSL